MHKHVHPHTVIFSTNLNNDRSTNAFQIFVHDIEYSEIKKIEVTQTVSGCGLIDSSFN